MGVSTKSFESGHTRARCTAASKGPSQYTLCSAAAANDRSSSVLAAAAAAAMMHWVCALRPPYVLLFDAGDEHNRKENNNDCGVRVEQQSWLSEGEGVVCVAS